MKEIPADIIYEDDISIAFNDISPQAPVHILVIPKKVMNKLSESTEKDESLLGHLLVVAKKITEENNIKDYRLVINNGVYGDRISRIASAYKFNKVELQYDWREQSNLEQIEDPASISGTEEEMMKVFRKVRQNILENVKHLITTIKAG